MKSIANISTVRDPNLIYREAEMMDKFYWTIFKKGGRIIECVNCEKQLMNSTRFVKRMLKLEFV